MTDNDKLDGCEAMTQSLGPHATDEEVALWPLFAEALDPHSPVTISQAERDWKELFGGVPN